MFLKKYIKFTLFTLKLSPFGLKGHEINNFLSPYPTYANIPDLVKISQVVLETKKRGGLWCWIHTDPVTFHFKHISHTNSQKIVT